MKGFKRVEKNHTPGLSVQCAECGRMMPYDRAFVGDKSFSFYHEDCIPQDSEYDRAFTRAK